MKGKKYTSIMENRDISVTSLISDDILDSDNFSAKGKSIANGSTNNSISLGFASHKIKKDKKNKSKQIIDLKKVLTDLNYQNSVVRKLHHKDTNEIIDKLRAYYLNDEYVYDPKDGKVKFLKELNLKWLPTKFINPVKEIKVNDNMFILDSSKYSTESQFSADNVISWDLYGLGKYKRVIRIKKNTIKDEFNLHIENATGYNTDNSNTVCHINYFKEWLMSLNMKQAKQLKDALDFMEQKMKQVFEEQMSTMNYTTMENRDNINFQNILSSSRIYINKQNSKTANWIKNQPYFIRYHQVDLETKEQSLEKVKLNNKFTNLLNYQPIIGNRKSGFEFLEKINSYSYVDVWISRLQTRKCQQEFEQLTGLTEVDEPVNLSKIPTAFKSKERQTIFNYTIYFEEKYIKNNIIYNAKYIVFK